MVKPTAKEKLLPTQAELDEKLWKDEKKRMRKEKKEQKDMKEGKVPKKKKEEEEEEEAVEKEYLLHRWDVTVDGQVGVFMVDENGIGSEYAKFPGTIQSVRYDKTASYVPPSQEKGNSSRKKVYEKKINNK